jgi:hypothetical protein
MVKISSQIRCIVQGLSKSHGVFFFRQISITALPQKKVTLDFSGDVKPWIIVVVENEGNT